jgi:hypothetical protein
MRRPISSTSSRERKINRSLQLIVACIVSVTENEWREVFRRYYKSSRIRFDVSEKEPET